MEIKDGKQTSELWYSLAVTAVGLLLTYGAINSDQAAAWLALIGAIIAIAPQLSYIISRTLVKRQAAGNYSVLSQLTGNVDAVEFPEVDIVAE